MVEGQAVTGQWLGGSGSDNDCQTFGLTYGKTTDVSRPSPSKLWVFGEEHPDSNNDSGMAVQIADYQPGNAAWIDIPNNLHGGACAFAFADGHVEFHKWIGGLMVTLKFIQNGNVAEINSEGVGQPVAQSAADLRDLNWIQARTSAPVQLSSAPGFPE